MKKKVNRKRERSGGVKWKKHSETQRKWKVNVLSENSESFTRYRFSELTWVQCFSSSTQILTLSVEKMYLCCIPQLYIQIFKSTWLIVFRAAVNRCEPNQVTASIYRFILYSMILCFCFFSASLQQIYILTCFFCKVYHHFHVCAFSVL